MRNRVPTSERLVYEGYVQFAYNLTVRYGFSFDDAADVTQDAMIKAFEKIRLYDPDRGTFKAWLARITIHEALRAKKKVMIDASRESLEKIEKHIIQSEIGDEFTDHIMQHLDETQKELYTLYFEYGMSHKEVAENLDISLANSRVKIHRLVKRIKFLFQ